MRFGIVGQERPDCGILKALVKSPVVPGEKGTCLIGMIAYGYDVIEFLIKKSLQAL